MATQFFFTICFVGMLIAIGMVLMYLLCIDDYYRVKVLKWIGVDLLLAGIARDSFKCKESIIKMYKLQMITFSLFSGACGTIALIIFGAQGDGRSFMPDWEQNYLSWSFGLAFVGVFFMYVVGVLFLVEARIMQRKELAKDVQEKQQYPMERTV